MTTLADFDIATIADVMDPRRPRERGWHVSALSEASQDIVRSAKPLNPMDYWWAGGLNAGGRADLDEKVPGILDMGRVWEAVSIRALDAWACKRGMIVQKPDRGLCVDGVWMTIDGILQTTAAHDEIESMDHPLAVVECKLRFTQIDDVRSSKAWEKWMRQVKSYCYGLGVRTAWVVVGSVTSRPPSAKSKIEIVTFTETELAENWQLIMNTKEYLERIGIDGHLQDTEEDTETEADVPW